MNLAFTSSLPSGCREELEELLFFNPSQHRVREGIMNSLERFGHPRLVEAKQALTVKVGEQDAQVLFAVEQGKKKSQLAGVIVFIRTEPEEIAIMHVAVDPDFALQGTERGVGLGVTLVEKVKEIARRIVGVKRIVFFYRREVIIRL